MPPMCPPAIQISTLSDGNYTLKVWGLVPFESRPRPILLSPPARKNLYLGGMGIRTPDLLIANETLYQLSYTPNEKTLMLTTPHFNPPEPQELQLMFVL